MGINLTDDELWSYMAGAHTGIITTLDIAGFPIALPTWFVSFDERVYLRTPAKAKKVGRIRRDDRASFLVEDGEQWVDLRAVLLVGHARVVEDEAICERVKDGLAEKYVAFRRPTEQLPEATNRHYGTTEAIIEITPDRRTVSWHNAKIRMRT